MTYIQNPMPESRALDIADDNGAVEAVAMLLAYTVGDTEANRERYTGGILCPYGLIGALQDAGYITTP